MGQGSVGVLEDPIERAKSDVPPLRPKFASRSVLRGRSGLVGCDSKLCVPETCHGDRGALFTGARGVELPRERPCAAICTVARNWARLKISN